MEEAVEESLEEDVEESVEEAVEESKKEALGDSKGANRIVKQVNISLRSYQNRHFVDMCTF